MDFKGKTAVFLDDSIIEGIYFVEGENGENKWMKADAKYCDIACEILGISIKKLRNIGHLYLPRYRAINPTSIY